MLVPTSGRPCAGRLISEAQVADVLGGFSVLPDLLQLENISNPNVTPESVVEGLLGKLPPPAAVKRARHDAVYRVALPY